MRFESLNLLQVYSVATKMVMQFGILKIIDAS